MSLMKKNGTIHEITIKYKNNKRNVKPITAYLVNTTQRQEQEQSPTKYKVKPRLPKYGSPSETTRIT
jgi:hypothetical protein